MDLEKIDLKLLKNLIFQIAKDDGVIFADIVKNAEFKPEIFKEHIIFLESLGLLEQQNIAIKLSGGEKLIPIKFKRHIETLQKIVNILDNKELSGFLTTQFYMNNVSDYCANLSASLKENALLPVPDTEYMEFALKNSPSSVRYFLIDNDINTLKSFYQRCISSTNENIHDSKRLELMERCHMYLIWENVIFGKIQEDKHNNTLLEPVSYFSGYLPVAKRSFEKIMELYTMVEKEPPKQKSKFKKYLKSKVIDKLSITGFF